MAAHNEFGKAGEQMAAEWLEQRGFQLIFRNWKHGRYEVDIIASREDVLHFIEVKSRHDDLFGKPEDKVDRKKEAISFRLELPFSKNIRHGNRYNMIFFLFC